jgi:hypothetical protein
MDEGPYNFQQPNAEATPVDRNHVHPIVSLDSRFDLFLFF